jgi:hypothetical protein
MKKLIAACRGMTCHAGVAWRKKYGRHGQGKENVVQGTRKGWTFGKKHPAQPECNNGIRNRDLKSDYVWEAREMLPLSAF